jgi:hypothetical protein
MAKSKRASDSFDTKKLITEPATHTRHQGPFMSLFSSSSSSSSSGLLTVGECPHGPPHGRPHVDPQRRHLSPPSPVPPRQRRRPARPPSGREAPCLAVSLRPTRILAVSRCRALSCSSRRSSWSATRILFDIAASHGPSTPSCPAMTGRISSLPFWCGADPRMKLAHRLSSSSNRSAEPASPDVTTPHNRGRRLEEEMEEDSR